MLYSRQEIYYLTLYIPHRGEQIVAAVKTDDRFLAEKIFGCGTRSEKGLGFEGLYREEEAEHMFRPGTNVIGTIDLITGQSKKHKDYHKAPVFLIQDDRIYKLQGTDRLLLDLPVKKNDFDSVFAVITGKRDPEKTKQVSSAAVSVAKQAASAKPVIPETKDSLTVDSYVLFSNQMDIDAPENTDWLEEDVSDVVFEDEEPEDIPEPVVQEKDVYSVLKKERSSDRSFKDSDYMSALDETFYAAQKQVVLSEDFKEDAKLQERFKTQVGQPIRKQGQSLKDLFRAAKEG